MRRVNGWLTVFWITMIPVAIITGWIHSVAFISAISLWALVAGHWSTWQAARVEVEQQREYEELEANPTEERVVEALLEQTTLERASGEGA
jgi:cell division protein FtsB